MTGHFFVLKFQKNTYVYLIFKERGAEGLVGAAGLVMRTSGPRGFFRGVAARVLYQMPAAAICWLTYETLKHALNTVCITYTI